MRESGYAPDHPVALALSALFAAIQDRRSISLTDLDQAAVSRGVEIGGATFDRAAALAGLPYSPSLDAYVDPETWASIELPVPHWRVPPETIADVRRHLA